MIIQGDCIEEMKKLDDESIDICIFDLPFNQICKSWDKEKINLLEMWEQLFRICKKHTPLFFFCTTKFGVNLINTAPKKMPFRYDIVWEKSSPVGFLNARKMPMRKHEMIYVFYKHLPLYDLSSHKHKFIKKKPMTKKPMSVLKTDDFAESKFFMNDTLYGKKIKRITDENGKGGLYCKNLKRFKYERKNSVYPNRSKAGEKSTMYDPPLPTSVKFCKSQRSRLHSTQKPVDLIKWLLKYFSKENDVCLDITAGSGSTGLACAEMNRKFILIEKEEKFINIINERLKKYL